MRAHLTEPTFCRPAAFELFSSHLEQLDQSPRALLNCAIAVSMHQLEDVEPAAVEAQLDSLAEEVRDRIQIPERKALIANLHSVLFDEARFCGDRDDFYNPLNSYLPAVLETRQGLPITLALVYRLVAERVGLRAVGVNSPGHFLASINLDGAPIYIDCFNGGREVSREEISVLLSRAMNQPIKVSSHTLRPATNREWVVRMIQNLQNIFIRTARINDFGAMLELRELLMARQDA